MSPVGVVFGFGSRPQLTDDQVELLAQRLDGLQPSTGGTLARRMRDGDDGQPIIVNADELEALLAVLAEARLAGKERAFTVWVPETRVAKPES